MCHIDQQYFKNRKKFQTLIKSWEFLVTTHREDRTRRSRGELTPGGSVLRPVDIQSTIQVSHPAFSFACHGIDCPQRTLGGLFLARYHVGRHDQTTPASAAWGQQAEAPGNLLCALCNFFLLPVVFRSTSFQTPGSLLQFCKQDNVSLILYGSWHVPLKPC